MQPMAAKSQPTAVKSRPPVKPSARDRTLEDPANSKRQRTTAPANTGAPANSKIQLQQTEVPAKLRALEDCQACRACQWTDAGTKGCRHCLGQFYSQMRLTREALRYYQRLVHDRAGDHEAESEPQRGVIRTRRQHMTEQREGSNGGRWSSKGATAARRKANQLWLHEGSDSST